MKSQQREIENLRRLLDIARYMAVTNDLDVLLSTIVEAACEVLACERATIFLYDGESDELYSRVAKGVESIRFSADRGIAGAAARTRQSVNVPDAYADPRFNRDVDLATGFRTRNLLTFPLENIQGELIGVLQALNKLDGAFDSDDEELARVLSAQAGVALERGKLIEEYAEKQRMQRDLDLARQIQQGLFPRAAPHVSGYEIAGWNRPADETGGDAYDFIPLADGRVAVFLADASGHGIGSALVIAQCRSLLRALLTVTQDLPRMLGSINDLLALDLSEDRFVTAFIGILDPVAHCIEYIAAGQGPLLRVGRGGVEARRAGAPPLTVMPGSTFTETQRFELTPGDTLILLTDGFYESTAPNGEQFGEERVVELVAASRGATLSNTITQLHAAVKSFVAGRPQDDDLTAVLIRRLA